MPHPRRQRRRRDLDTPATTGHRRPRPALHLPVLHPTAPALRRPPPPPPRRGRPHHHLERGAAVPVPPPPPPRTRLRSEEHTSELQSLMRTSSAVLCFKNKTTH